MLALIGTLISGVLSGGATGLLGVIIQRFFDLKTKDRDLTMLKLQHEQALALAQIEAASAQRRAEADEFAADRAAQAREMEADGRSMVASFEHDQAQYLEKSAQSNKWVVFAFTLVDTIRGLIRPIITTYLVVLTTMMFIWAKELAGDNALSQDQALTIIGQIVATILYLASACTLWWFGSRPPKKS